MKIENQNHQKYIILQSDYKPRQYTVEADFSQGAFFLVAGAIGNDVKATGLNKNSLQGDKQILDILKQCGANMQIDEEGITASSDSLKSITIDAKNIPDLVPILAVLCTFCKGESKIINAGRLRLKESDRLAAITTELNKLGAKIEEGQDYLKIQGVESLKGGAVDSWNDHRIAMALAIASTRCNEPVIINGKDSVKKSYPDFWDDFNKMRGE